MLKFLSFSMFFASLFSFFGGGRDSLYEKNKAKMNKIINHSIDQLSQRYGLVPIGRGGGVKDEKSWLETVSFQLDKNVTKEEARILLVESVELFLSNINSNKEITPYLYDTPFTHRNLQIIIFINHSDGSDTFDPELCVIASDETGMVKFRTNDPNNEYRYASSLKEPYEEAYKIATGREYPRSAQATQNTSEPQK